MYCMDGSQPGSRGYKPPAANRGRFRKRPSWFVDKLPGTDCMYIWRKHATSKWLSDRSNDLLERFGMALAIVEQPGTARSVIQISTTKKAGTALVGEFGGALEKLSADWLQKFAKRSRSNPIKIGSRLVVTPTGPLKDKKTIVIPAEADFSTGEKDNTAKCLRLVER